MSIFLRAAGARTALAAILMIGAFTGPALAQAPQNRTSSPAKSEASKPALGACRVTERSGGKTCTANVPEAACQYIAREGGGPYAWTDEGCP